ncbi:addiction module antidote protein [Rhizobium sp. YTU87027]|uniref:addiction module antidote protein n=1 Tax=Rhizobium sp. YTU87027 TaxID=3417741 RepID=UPI003D68C81C
MALETTRFDIQNYIKSHEDQTGYLDAVLEDGDPALIAAAIGDIARGRGASQFAKDSGLSRETIYKVFRPGGNPTLDTIAKAVKVLGLRLSLVPASNSTKGPI